MNAALALLSAEDLGRQTIQAVNEATLLREVLVREIRALGALYCVGKRRPISELTPEQQQLVRDAYAETNWSSDYGIELIGIYTSENLARQACKERGPNYFFTKLPIDSALPDEPVFGEWAHQFPGSDAADLYENMQSKTLALRVEQLRVIDEEVERLRDLIRSVRPART